MSYASLRAILERMPRESDAAQVIGWFADRIRDDLELTP